MCKASDLLCTISVPLKDFLLNKTLAFDFCFCFPTHFFLYIWWYLGITPGFVIFCLHLFIWISGSVHRNICSGAEDQTWIVSAYIHTYFASPLNSILYLAPAKKFFFLSRKKIWIFRILFTLKSAILVEWKQWGLGNINFLIPNTNAAPLKLD